jgi:hypothetical protein
MSATRKVTAPVGLRVLFMNDSLDRCAFHRQCIGPIRLSTAEVEALQPHAGTFTAKIAGLRRSQCGRARLVDAAGAWSASDAPEEEELLDGRPCAATLWVPALKGHGPGEEHAVARYR